MHAPNLRLRSITSALVALCLLGCSTSPSTSTTTTTTTTTTPAPVIIANLTPYPDTTGTVATYTSAGQLDESTAFFTALGTNTRTCASCHQLSQGMSISPTALQALFTSTSGTDPVFSSNDGANCPTVATGNLAGHSLLLNSGLIRIAITLPSTAQFTITTLNDPYGCATTLNTTGQQIVSVYRRPLPTAGLPFLSSVMWDTRQTVAALNNAATLNAAFTTDLTSQLNDAVATHEQGTAIPTAAQTTAILTLQQGLFTAQTTDTLAGSLSAGGARGGPSNLAAQAYYPGVNDTFGADPTGAAFTNAVFTLYPAWSTSTNPQQASISRGEALFNTAPMMITNVGGLPPPAGNGAKPTCSFCHDTPNIGNHSLPLPLDTAIARLAASETDPNILAGLAQLSAPTLPTYQITGCKAPGGAPITYVTTDPGKALSTGLCSDVNLQKLPSLRGLAARAPYFHNGSATTLTQLVNFYNARFQMNLNAGQKADLVNFLGAL